MWAQSITTAAVQIPILAFGGYWLDSQWGTFPWLLLIGVALGMLGGIWLLYRLVRFFDQ